MPSQRPKIVVYSDEKTINKLQYIAQEEKRRVSNYCDILIQKHIAEYEQEHGKIVLPESVEE